jgi:hypothetical protein
MFKQLEELEKKINSDEELEKIFNSDEFKELKKCLDNLEYDNTLEFVGLI